MIMDVQNVCPHGKAINSFAVWAHFLRTYQLINVLKKMKYSYQLINVLKKMKYSYQLLSIV